MDDLPLSRLLPDDPQNCLSDAARQRVLRAQLECTRIRQEALASADARQLPDRKLRYVLNQANLRGARTVLKVLSAEYVAAGLSLQQFWDAMRNEIDSVATSFSLLDSQRLLLEAEFLTPPEQKCTERSRAAPAPAPAKATESVGAQIKALCSECHLSPDELAVKIGIDVRSVRRHLTDRSLPYDRTLWAYETLFSKLLNRKVVIHKLS
jgi:hypothetical protein